MNDMGWSSEESEVRWIGGERYTRVQYWQTCTS